ncbi:MAG: hypothetical protein IJ733_21005 [Lachnospiraceae bacterium]|nr:hypothetical protein [Lachnospiraceae bacterium]
MMGMALMAAGKFMLKLIKTILWIILQLLRFGLEIVKILLLFTGNVLKLFLIVLHAGNS